MENQESFSYKFRRIIFENSGELFLETQNNFSLKFKNFPWEFRRIFLTNLEKCFLENQNKFPRELLEFFIKIQGEFPSKNKNSFRWKLRSIFYENSRDFPTVLKGNILQKFKRISFQNSSGFFSGWKKFACICICLYISWKILLILYVKFSWISTWHSRNFPRDIILFFSGYSAKFLLEFVSEFLYVINSHRFQLDLFQFLP